MLLNIANPTRKLLNTLCYNCRLAALSKCYLSDSLDSKYTEEQKEKILQVINDSDTLSSYDISKVKLKKISQYRSSNGQIQTLSDVEYIEGFSEKSSKKLFTSILNGVPAEKKVSNKIKGQILHPNLSESVVKECERVLSVYVTVNSVCWTLIDKDNYGVLEWEYFSIDYPDGKRLQITDLLSIAWRVTQQLPTADIYVMKAEATTLRAAGSDPNNPKVMAVNLQKSQMISMIVALINARSLDMTLSGDHKNEENILEHKVYFLRPTLPYRLYGTLVGNERVSTDQTVDMLLRDLNERSSNNSHAYVSERLQNMFRSQKDLQKDMLGHCLLLSLTFMDLCVYKNQAKIAKLMKKRED
ncbi:transcription elongation factor, mitochondrial [Anticarsia gemmatalis]|uniref:transcription elongation factor, mitochondrial n=1 Tax=Anticarsia gemmatalis TaxID=129554 RepID=UPI003F758BB9